MNVAGVAEGLETTLCVTRGRSSQTSPQGRRRPEEEVKKFPD